MLRRGTERPTHPAFWIGLGLAILALAGCGRRETPVEAGIAQSTLYLGNGQEPSDLDPQITDAYNDYNILIALFEGLTCIDEATSRPVPGMADHWDISPDGLVYTFHLRPGIVWSNADPVTADDFVYSIRRIANPRIASDYAYLVFPVRGAEAFAAGRLTDPAQIGAQALDARTLRIVLDHPCPYFLSIVAHQAWFPVHAATLERFGAATQRGTAWTRPGNLVGNGAFLLKAWIPNSRVVLVKNPRYWDAGRNRLNEIVFFPTDDVAADERAFRAGQVDVTNDLVPSQISYYRGETPSPLRIDPLSESFFLRFNVTRAPLDNPAVRQALARAIDREAIARDVLFGSRRPANALTPANTGGYTSATQIPTDFAEARRRLAAAGYPGGRGFPTLRILMNTDPINTQIMEAIQQMWSRELGIRVSLENQDFRVYLDNLEHLRYDIARSRWVGDYDDPSDYLDLFRSDSGNNQTGWAQPAYDHLLDQANQTMDPVRRYARLQQAEALLLQDAPVAPIYFGTRTYLIQPFVRGWVPSLLGIHRYQYVWLEP
jgi:oligopeptide transport system substrate-binding protein